MPFSLEIKSKHDVFALSVHFVGIAGGIKATSQPVTLGSTASGPLPGISLLSKQVEGMGNS